MNSIGAILYRAGAHLAGDPELQDVTLEGQVYDLKVYPRMSFWKIKDETDNLSCVSFRQDLDLEPEAQVRVRGTVGIYRGCCQLRVVAVERIGETVDPLAEGMASLADVLREPHPIPRLWQVGIVSSLAAAGLKDCLTALAGSGLQIRIYTARVQGESAPEEIRAAIGRALADGVQCLALVRGGGSREDLVAWDDPSVARAVCLSPVPVVTGIGHQIDTTLVDLVADLRCITPTEAGVQLRARATLLTDLVQALHRRLAERRLQLEQARGQLRALTPDYAQYREALARWVEWRLSQSRQGLVEGRRQHRIYARQLLIQTWDERWRRYTLSLVQGRARVESELRPRIMCGERAVTRIADLGDHWELYLPDGVVEVRAGQVWIRAG